MNFLNGCLKHVNISLNYQVLPKLTILFLLIGKNPGIDSNEA